MGWHTIKQMKPNKWNHTHTHKQMKPHTHTHTHTHNTQNKM